MAVALLVVAASAAVGVPSDARGRAVGDTVAFDGQVTGTGTFNGDQDCEPNLDVTQDAAIALDGGGGADLHVAYCLSAFDPAVPLTPVYDGTFTITTDDGTVSGTATGTVAAASGPGGGYATHLVLAATAGTGRLAGSVTIGEVPPTTVPTSTPGSLGVVTTSIPPPPRPAAAVPGSPRFTG